MKLMSVALWSRANHTILPMTMLVLPKRNPDVPPVAVISAMKIILDKLIFPLSMSSPKILNVKPFRQTTGLCGPASLKIALSYFGREYSESHLAELSAATTQHGTEHADLIKAVKQLGGAVITNEHASISDVENLVVKQKLPVIIGWFDEDEDHYSVVVGATPKYLITQDPEVGGIRRLPKSKFPAIWFDFVGPENKIVSWVWFLAIIFPPSFASPL